MKAPAPVTSSPQTRSLTLFAAVVLLWSGCAHDYLYVPVGPNTAGGPAARYPIPPNGPQGEAYVTSFGFTEMEAEAGMPGTMLHARFAVSNGSGVAWTFDSRLQSLAAPGRPPQGAAFLNTDAGVGPIYPVPPGQARVFDMYFALTPPQDQAPNLQGFELEWNLDAGGQPVTGRTSFQRFEGSGGSYDPYPPYVAVGLGFGVGWWYGPAYYPYRRMHAPIIRRYYFPPARGTAGPWRGSPPGRSGGPGLRGTPPAAGAGWRGTPPGSTAPAPGGGLRGTPPASSSVRAAPLSTPRSSPVRSGGSRGGGFRGGGGRGRGR
jgi:hypothetical protein